MTKAEAILLMLAGKKVTHRFFTDDEWITMDDDNNIVSEDGVKCPEDEWWSYRQGVEWLTDWKEYSMKLV